jgi:hypothetical protein
MTDENRNYAFIGDLQIVEEAASACASFGEFADNIAELKRLRTRHMDEMLRKREEIESEWRERYD